MEKYVEYISNDKLRMELAAFRLSAHNLDIERGRHVNVPREKRTGSAVSAQCQWWSRNFIFCWYALAIMI